MNPIEAAYAKLEEIPESYWNWDKIKQIGIAIEFCKENKIEKKQELIWEHASMNKPLSFKGEIGDVWKYALDTMPAILPWTEKESLPYFEKRLSETKNSFLKAKYSYICWIINKRKPQLESCQENLLKTAEQYVSKYLKSDYWEIAPFCYSFALKLSLITRNESESKKILESIMSGIKTEINAKSERWSLELLKILAGNKGTLKNYASEKRINKMIKETIQLVDKMTKKYKGKNQHFERNFLIYLSELFRIIGRNPDADKTNLRIAESHEAEANNAPNPLIKTIFLGEAAKAYNAIGNKKKVEELKKGISESSKEIEWKKIVTKIILEKEKLGAIEEGIKNLSQLPVKEMVKHLSEKYQFYIPRSSEIGIVEEIKKDAKLHSMLPKIIVEENFPKKSLNTEAEREEDEIKNQMVLSNQMLRGLVIGRTFLELEKIKSFEDEILTKIMKSCFKDNTKRMITRGINKHSDHEYIESIHFMTLMVEPAIRDIVKKNGLIPKVIREDEFRNQQLQGLLRKPEIVCILGKDFSEYLDITLTDPLYENIRNKIAHGEMLIEEYNPSLSATILLILLRLATY